MEVVFAKYGSAGAIQFSSIHPSNEIVNTTLGLGIDSLDRIYISSDAKAGTQDFNPGPGVDNLTIVPQLATYVSRITQAGDYDGSFVFEGQASGTVVPSEIFVTGSGTIYIAGSNGGSGDVDINPGAGAAILSPNGDLNGFAASYTMASSYGITGLGSGYSVVDASTGTEIAANSIPAGTTKQVRLLKDGVPIALIDITFDSDSIWTSVSGDSDRTTGRAVVDGFGSVIGAASTHGLYVPRGEADTQVTICPNVTSLAEVDASCSNPETFVASDDNVQIVSLGGNSYWLVTGLSGTGGFTIVGEADTSTSELVETGTNLILYPFLGVVIVTATVALKRFSR